MREITSFHPQKSSLFFHNLELSTQHMPSVFTYPSTNEGMKIAMYDKALSNKNYQIVDTRPPSARPNFSNTADVDKYVLPEEEYEKKSDSVLAWKKAEKLGRFNPDAPSHEQAKIAAVAREIEARGISVGKRCRIGQDDTRRGEIKYVGDVKEIPGLGAWVGVQLDEPVGKNDGSIGGTRYWGQDSELKRGIFVRPERVEVGGFPVLDDLEDKEEMEEI